MIVGAGARAGAAMWGPPAIQHRLSPSPRTNVSPLAFGQLCASTALNAAHHLGSCMQDIHSRLTNARAHPIWEHYAFAGHSV